MDRLIRRAGIEHSLYGINIRDLPIFNHKASRRIHPRVRANNEPGRRQPADPDRERAEPVRSRRQPVPTVQVEAQEDSLQEKCEALKSEGRAD